MGMNIQKKPDHNHQKKIAVINDFCGFGRSSLSVQLPIISACGIQCCPLPTGYFSCHTGFPHFTKADLTEYFEAVMNDWQENELCFDGIATGFLNSIRQIDLIRSFIERFRTGKTVVLVDPVMGDYGRLYPGYDDAMAAGMKELVSVADILTPNLTEASMLTGNPYREDCAEKELLAMAEQLSAMGPKQVVISGLDRGNTILNFVYDQGRPPEVIQVDRIGLNRSGTGDVFSSVLLAGRINGKSFRQSVKDSTEFISRVLRTTEDMEIPVTDGVCIEEHLQDLRRDV